MEKIKKLLDNTAIRVIIACAVIFLAGIIYSITSNANEITQKFVRFHIIANSDDEKDQTVKMKIREEIFKELNLTELNSKQKAIDYFTANKPKIEDIADNILKADGFDYKSNVKVGKKQFPVRTYNDFTLPSGVYDAVSIELGEAKGANFFCVMYPSLCLINGISENSDENIKILNNTLTEEEAKVITGDNVVIKFKIAEIFNSIKDSF